MRAFIRVNMKDPTEERVRRRIMGGSPLLMYMLRDFLKYKDVDVEIWPNVPAGEYDLAIHCDYMDENIKAKHHILWGGSWTSQYNPKADVKIIVTQFMKDHIEGWDDALVIPAPFNVELLKYRMPFCEAGKIICTSNPNRHYKETVALAKRLKKRMVNFRWCLTGGNNLYSQSYPEMYHLASLSDGIFWMGALDRKELFKIMAVAQIWAYPGFNQTAETQGVAPIESMALGIPTIVPRKDPFIEVAEKISPQPFMCDNLDEFEEVIYRLFDGGPKRIDYDVSYYRSDIIMPRWWNVIEGLRLLGN